MRVYTNKELSCFKALQRSAESSASQDSSSIKLPSLIDALESLDLEFERSVLSEERSLVESVFSLFQIGDLKLGLDPSKRFYATLKHRIKIFFFSISSFNPFKNWYLFFKLFMLYYNRLRWCLC